MIQINGVSFCGVERYAYIFDVIGFRAVNSMGYLTAQIYLNLVRDLLIGYTVQKGVRLFHLHGDEFLILCDSKIPSDEIAWFERIFFIVCDTIDGGGGDVENDQPPRWLCRIMDGMNLKKREKRNGNPGI